MEESMKDIMNSIIPMIKGNNILDIGTGFGTVIKSLINNKDMNITSIDPEEWRFDELKNTFLNEIYENKLKLLNASAEELPFNNNEFTTAISLFSAHHFKNIIKAMNEIYRVTSKVIIIIDWSPESSGITNPHPQKDLEYPMSIIKNYAKKNNYKIKDDKMWYLIYKII